MASIEVISECHHPEYGILKLASENVDSEEKILVVNTLIITAAAIFTKKMPSKVQAKPMQIVRSLLFRTVFDSEISMFSVTLLSFSIEGDAKSVLGHL
jgi:hypothetical protein